MSFDRLPLALALSLTILSGALLTPTTAFAANAVKKNLPQTVAGYLTQSDRAPSPEDSLKALHRFDYPIYVAAKDDSDKTASKDSSDDGDAKSDPKKEKAAKKAAKDKEAQDKKDAKDLKDQKEAAKKADGDKTQKDKEKDKDGKAKADEKKPAKADKNVDKDKDKDKDKKDKAAEANVEKDKKKNKKDGNEKAGEHKSEEKPAQKSEAKSETKAEAQAEQKANLKADAKGAPVFVPDDALISVLKDVNRALADSQTEAVAKVENANEKLILGMAQEIFSKALTEPNLNANRILPKDDEHQAKTQLTAESWSSGDVEVNDKLRGSMAAVWAKRIGGLVTVTIAGDAGQRKTTDGSPIGEFMVVLTAHSPVQKGFDIQSQADVTFWIGKLNAITIEANCVPGEGDGEKVEASSNSENTSPGPAGSEAKKKSIVSLRPLLTNRYRNHYAVLLAADIQSQKELAAIAAAADQTESERAAASGDEGPATQSAEKMAASGDDGASVEQGQKSENGEKNREKGSDKDVRDARDAKVAKIARVNKDTVEPKGDKSQKPEKAAVVARNLGETAKQATNNGDNHRVSLASNTTATNVAGATTAAAVIEGPHFNFPSASSTLLMPDKALAGQYVTVALLDRSRHPEANVELSFNGASLTTDASGQAVYQIPEDTPPGRSLNIALSSRPDEIPSTLEVFQPLNITTGQAPRLDRLSPLAVRNSVMTVEGHNFDGLAHNNTVIIDGSQEGKIVSASPFQLKFVVPEGMTPGPHSLCVSTDGMRSNLGGFDYADTQVTVDGKDTGKENAQIRLMIKVLGTAAKLNVKVLNQTPDVVRMNRGAEMTVTTGGGLDNNVILPAVRGKKGPYKIDTQIEM
jgi:hypothetical protein